MKLTSILVLISISLCAGLCCRENDDDFPPQIIITNNSIVEIENNQNNYSVGDEIVIETNIPLDQTTTSGQEINLSDYDYSEPESAYRYYLSLYKLNEFGSISRIPLMNSNISLLQGNTTIENGLMFIEASFNGNSYTNKVSITLPETGQFYLAGTRFIQNNNGELEILGGVSEFAFVKIASIIVNAPDEGFEFFVN